jgi:hypothetical protein
MKRLGSVLVFAATLAASGPVFAQDAGEGDVAEARQQYQQGRDAFTAKRYVEAALHFEAAAAQRPHAVALYTAALAWEAANRPERAADAYGRALEVPGLSADQAAKARERVATLEKTLGTLAVMVPDGWKVQLDDLTEATGHTRLHAAPGAHVLKVRAPNKPLVKRDVTLEAGQITRIELTEESLEPAPAPPKPEPPKPEPKPEPSQDAAKERASEGGSPRKTLGFVAVGVGGAAILSGIVLGTQALSARDAYNEAPSRAGFDHAESLATWTTVSFVAGGLIAAAGVALIVWPEAPARATVGMSPQGVALRGAF